MCQRASLFARGRGNILPGNARDVIAAYTHGMADERPLRDGLVRQPARGISPRPLCASRAEAGREAPFDRDYYRRFYFNPRTAVATREEMRSRARLIAALTAHAGLPVRRILEARGAARARELRQAVPRRALLQRPDRARSRAQQRSAAHRCRCPPEERPLVSRAAEASVPRGGPRVLAASRSAPHALGAGVSLTG